jgi:hypothetical protein
MPVLYRQNGFIKVESLPKQHDSQQGIEPYDSEVQVRRRTRSVKDTSFDVQTVCRLVGIFLQGSLCRYPSVFWNRDKRHALLPNRLSPSSKMNTQLFRSPQLVVSVRIIPIGPVLWRNRAQLPCKIEHHTHDLLTTLS